MEHSKLPFVPCCDYKTMELQQTYRVCKRNGSLWNVRFHTVTGVLKFPHFLTIWISSPRIILSTFLWFTSCCSHDKCPFIFRDFRVTHLSFLLSNLYFNICLHPSCSSVIYESTDNTYTPCLKPPMLRLQKWVHCSLWLTFFLDHCTSQQSLQHSWFTWASSVFDLTQQTY